MKYVNNFNRGVAKVQEKLKENGNPPAKFDVNTLTAFRVVVEATTEKVHVNVRVNIPLNGGIIGLTYMLLIYVASSILNNGFMLNIYSIFMLVIGIAAGIVGGIVGVNMK